MKLEVWIQKGKEGKVKCSISLGTEGLGAIGGCQGRGISVQSNLRMLITIVENWKELRGIKTDNAYVLARLEDNTTKMQILS